MNPNNPQAIYTAEGVSCLIAYALDEMLYDRVPDVLWEIIDKIPTKYFIDALIATEGEHGFQDIVKGRLEEYWAELGEAYMECSEK